MTPLGVCAAHLATLTEYGEGASVVRSEIRPAAGACRPVDAVPSLPRRSPSRSLPRVKLQEADAKSLLVAQGLPVPAWTVAHTAAEARDAAAAFLDAGADK